MKASQDSPARILVRAPNWVGDVVMATPALRALRAAHPAAEILLEGRPFLAGLVAGLPSLDGFLADPGDNVAQRARSLREQRFDWAVLLPDSFRSALAPFLARIPVRAGYARDALRRALLTRALRPPLEDGQRVPLVMTQRYLRITEALGCASLGDGTELAVDADSRARIRARLSEHGVAPDGAYAVVTPGASFGASKLWPTDHFAQACDGLSRELGLRPVLAPGPGEEAIAREIVARMHEPAACLDEPPTRLDELKALIGGARLQLGGDTGPRQIAVALGTPAVVVMGPTDPRHSAHGLDRQRVLREPVDCSPCHLKRCPIDHRCMTRLAPERAVSAARELLLEAHAER